VFNKIIKTKMRKILLKSAIIGVLFSFAACSSDSGSTSCADHEAAYEKAFAKYEASESEADCLAAANIVKNALAAKCISTEEAAAYAASLPCYTSGDDEDCTSLMNQITSAISAYTANPSAANCDAAVSAFENSVEAGCMSEDIAIAMAEAAGLNCI